jgi:hypothetical protein
MLLSSSVITLAHDYHGFDLYELHMEFEARQRILEQINLEFGTSLKIMMPSEEELLDFFIRGIQDISIEEFEADMRRYAQNQAEFNRMLRESELTYVGICTETQHTEIGFFEVGKIKAAFLLGFIIWIYLR